MATSAWSTEAWTDTLGGTMSDVFVDNFEAQPLGVSPGPGLNSPVGDPNAEWTYASGEPAGSSVKVQDGPDTRALHHTFAAGSGYALAQAAFELGSVYSDVSLEFKLYIPDGTESYGGAAYKHRYNGSSSTNQKLFRLWAGASYYTDNKVGASLWRIDDDTSELALDLSLFKDTQSAVYPRYNVIVAATKGTWITLRFDIIGATPATGTKIKAYLDGSLIIDYENTTYIPVGDPFGFDRGYILGTWNTGFDETTIMVVDDFKVTS